MRIDAGHVLWRSLAPVARLALGALVVGTLDISDALIFYAVRGVAPMRILQGIAAGLRGRAAFSGGVPTALLGLCLHFFIATAIVLTFFVLASAVPRLVRRPLVSGPVYGVVVFCVMNYVVIPLSAINMPPFNTARLVNGLLIHILGVGLPAAWSVRAALASKTTVSGE